jgi:adenylate kinase
MLRAAVTAGSELGLEAKKVMDEGGLVADETMIGIITSRLAEADCVEKGWLLDGFPRTGAQAEGLKAANIECDKFIYLEVPDDVLLARVTGRRLDPVTGTIYHTEFKPAPDEEVAGRLEQRSDDTEEKLKPRLEAFHTNLESILGSYTDKMFKTDGNRDPKVVWEEIKAELDK